jgi:hypothetical protein
MVTAVLAQAKPSRAAIRACRDTRVRSAMAKSERIDMTNQRFGRLVVTSFAEKRENHGYWLCQCDCGATKVISGRNLRKGLTASCGCLHRDMIRTFSLTHGLSRSPTYGTWGSMHSRCTNPKQQAYARYGAVGIRVCERWRTFDNFLFDMGKRPRGMTLDRINPFGDYEPNNCEWATQDKQTKNTRGRLAVAVLGYMKNAGYGNLIDAAFAALTGVERSPINPPDEDYMRAAQCPR